VNPRGLWHGVMLLEVLLAPLGTLWLLLLLPR
jgi:hypothetical protein